MKRDFLFYCLMTILLSMGELHAQTDLLDTAPSEPLPAEAASTMEMTEGPQTLPVEEQTQEAATEVIRATQETQDGPEGAPPAEISSETEIRSEPRPEGLSLPQESSLQQKTGVVAEEDLFKTNSKKTLPKVKTEKVTESEIYIQEADKYKLADSYKNLQLNDVIEQGLRKNYDQRLRMQRQEITDIEFSGAKSAFWMPELKISLVTDSQKIATIRSSNRQPAVPNSTSPSGTLGLSLGNYTVFNWGKDYALYLNQKETYQRSKQILDESSRELKLDLIRNYFNLVAFKNTEKFRQDQLRHASFVYRLNKEKITIGKTTKQDYYQARSEYLRAQNDYHQAKISADQADEEMAFLITDAIGTKYVINESLEYRRLKMSLDEAMAFAEKQNPTLLTNKVLINNAGRNYDVALKENMPLPKFSVNLGAYNQRFGPQTNTTRYETYSGSGNVELVASINASWSLTGEDGLLNSNKLATSRLNRDIAIKELEKNTHFTQSFVRQTYKTILSLQNQIVILEARLPSLQKTFDTVLENYLAGRSKFYDFSLALEDLTNTKIFFEQIKLQHLQEKLNLAKIAGLEDFPGENFEHLAQRATGK